MGDPIIEVYEKFKHLDQLLSDPQFIANPMERVRAEMWLAIKTYAEGNKKSEQDTPQKEDCHNCGWSTEKPICDRPECVWKPREDTQKEQKGRCKASSDYRNSVGCNHDCIGPKSNCKMWEQKVNV